MDGGHVHWEWPRWAECHDLEVVQKMVADLGLRAAFLDGCQVGARDPHNGLLYLKPWIIYTSSATMLKALSLRCSRDHVHQSIVAGRAAATAYYPLPMARRVVKAMVGRPPWEKGFDGEGTAYVNTLTKKLHQEVFPLVNNIPLDPSTRKKITEQILSLHRRSGHPNFKDMAETFQARGATSSGRFLAMLVWRARSRSQETQHG